MKHISEELIELYVLGAGSVRDQREEMEAHFHNCYGCRSLAEEIGSYYQDAAKRMGTSERRHLRSSEALARRRHELILHGPYKPAPSYWAPQTPVLKFRHFARMHPIATGVGGLSLAAAIIAMAWIGFTRITADKNPSYIHINPQSSLLEVYNKEHEELWSIPVAHARTAMMERISTQADRAVVADLDGKGMSEIITALPIGGEKAGGNTLLRIFNYDKSIRAEVAFREPLQFRGAIYQNDLSADFFHVTPLAADEKEEFVFVALSNGRSPHVLASIDPAGKIMGEYYHFGLVTDIASYDLNGDNKMELIICGVNDCDELTTGRFGFIAILDPSKITGKKESSATRGFGLERSDAELYYIRLPITDMHRALHSLGGAKRMQIFRYDTSDALGVWSGGSYTYKGEEGHPMFEYIFGKDMRVLAVKYQSQTKDLRDELVAEGKLSGQLDDVYLDSLKHRVEYWDGTSWRKEVCRVGSPVVTAISSTGETPTAGARAGNTQGR